LAFYFHILDSIFVTALRWPTTCWRTTAARRICFLPTHQPTNQPTSQPELPPNSMSLPPFSHSCARNALLGCEKDIWKCNRDCAYADGFPVLARSGRHCFAQLTASVAVLEQCTTIVTLSPVHVPQICHHLQLILKEACSDRTLCANQAHTLVTAAHCMHLKHTHTGHSSTLYAPQAHTLATAAHCMHVRHTHWSLQHTVRTSSTHTGYSSTLYAPQAHTLATPAHCTT